MPQQMLSNKWAMGIIAFMICTGWLAAIVFVGYCLYAKDLTFAELITAMTGFISTLIAGGGVHFIYNRNGGHGPTTTP